MTTVFEPTLLADTSQIKAENVNLDTLDQSLKINHLKSLEINVVHTGILGRVQAISDAFLKNGINNLLRVTFTRNQETNGLYLRFFEMRTCGHCVSGGAIDYLYDFLVDEEANKNELFDKVLPPMGEKLVKNIEAALQDEQLIAQMKKCVEFGGSLLKCFEIGTPYLRNYVRADGKRVHKFRRAIKVLKIPGVVSLLIYAIVFLFA